MARVEVNYDGIKAAMQSDKVRAALRSRAQPIAGRANQIAQGERTRTQPARVIDGTRPKGRPYSRVQIDDGAAQEWGTSKTARRRILGRAAGIE